LSSLQALVGEYRISFLKGQTGNDILVCPAGYRINSIEIVETAGHAVTGGIKIGTTNGGTDVVAAQTVTASSYNSVADASILKRYFGESYGSDQALYVQAVSAWNSASINIYMTLMRLMP
jgi:hypothetical protein